MQPERGGGGEKRLESLKLNKTPQLLNVLLLRLGWYSDNATGSSAPVCVLCVQCCAETLQADKTQAFNEQSISFPHTFISPREREREREREYPIRKWMERKLWSDKKLRKSFRLKWSSFSADHRGGSFVPVKFNLPFRRWATLQLLLRCLPRKPLTVCACVCVWDVCLSACTVPHVWICMSVHATAGAGAPRGLICMRVWTERRAAA